MTVKVDIDFNPLIQGMAKIIKSTADFNAKTKTSSKSVEAYGKSLYQAEVGVMKFAKSVGMTKAQMNQLLKTINGIHSSTLKSKKSFDDLKDKNKQLAKEVASLTRELAKQQKQIDKMSKGVNNHSKTLDENTKKQGLNSLTIKDWVRHAQRLIRYYALIRLSMLAYGEALDTVTKGAEFEHSIRTLSGVLRKTVSEVQPLTDRILKLGASTEWTASQISDAARLLAMAGLDMREVGVALSSTLDLATAGNIDLARAADISTNIMSGFGLEVEQLTKVNDVLIATITRTNSTIEELGEAMKYAAPVAKAFGYEIEEVSTLLGILHNAGIKGSMAGTNLARAMFQTTKVFANLKGETVALADLLGEGKAGLSRALQGMKDEMWGTDKVMKVMGDRAAKAALIFLDLETQIEELNKKINESAYESKELAETMRGSLINEYKELISIIEDLKIQILTDNIDTLREALDKLKWFFRENREELKKLGDQMFKVVDATIYMITNFKDLVNTLGVLVGGYIALELIFSKILLLLPLITVGFLALRIRIGAIVIGLLSFRKTATATFLTLKLLAPVIFLVKKAFTALAFVITKHPILLIGTAILLIGMNLKTVKNLFTDFGGTVSLVIEKVKETLNSFLKIFEIDYQFKLKPVVDKEALDKAEAEIRKREKQRRQGEGNVGLYMNKSYGTAEQRNELAELEKQEKLLKERKSRIIEFYEQMRGDGMIDTITAEREALEEMARERIQLSVTQVERLDTLRKAESEFYIYINDLDDEYLKHKHKNIDLMYKDSYEKNLSTENALRLSNLKKLEIDEQFYKRRQQSYLDYYKWTGDQTKKNQAVSNADEMFKKQGELLISKGYSKEEAEKIVKLKQEQFKIDLKASKLQKKSALSQIELGTKLEEFGEWEKNHWNLKKSSLEEERDLQLSLNANKEKRAQIKNDYEVSEAKLNAEMKKSLKEQERFLGIEKETKKSTLDITRQIGIINSDYFSSSTQKYNEIIALTRERINLEADAAKTETDRIKIRRDGEIEIFDLEQERADLQRQTLAELKQGLYESAIALAQMVADGNDLNASLRETARAVGSTVGQAVGSYYGGPAGGAAGSVVGGVLGSRIGQGLFPGGGSGESAVNNLNSSIDDLNQSIIDLNNSIEFDELSNSYIISRSTEIINQLKEAQDGLATVQATIASTEDALARAKRNIEREGKEDKEEEDEIDSGTAGYMEASNGLQDTIHDLETALRILRESEIDYTELILDLMTELTPLVNELSQMAATARGQVDSMVETRESERLRQERENYSSREWETLLQRLGEEAFNWKRQIVSSEDLTRLYGDDETSPEYMLAKAKSDYAQIMYADLLSQLDEAERQYLEVQEATIDAIETSTQDAIDSLEEQRDLLQDQLDTLENIAKSVRDLKANLLASELNPDQSYAFAQSRYSELKSKILDDNNNIKADVSDEDYQRYLEYVNTYLEKSQEYYKNSGEYESAFLSVMSDLNTIEAEVQTEIDTLSQTISFLNTNISTLETALEALVLAFETEGADLSSAISVFGEEVAGVITNLTGELEGIDSLDGTVIDVGQIITDAGGDLTTALDTLGTDFETALGDLAYTIDTIEWPDFDAITKGIGRYTTGGEDDGSGLVTHYAAGGIASGPTSGYPATLHGTEAVIPLKNGSVPVTMNSTGDNRRIEELLELILVNASQGSKVEVSIDGGQLDGRIERVADNNRVRAANQGIGRRNLVL